MTAGEKGDAAHGLRGTESGATLLLDLQQLCCNRVVVYALIREHIEINSQLAHFSVES